MKNAFLIILYFLLIFELISQGPSSSTNTYDYSNYSAKRINENLTASSAIIESTSSKESVVYVTSHGININGSQLKKSGGDMADEDIEESNFYGVNSVVLVQGGEVTITGMSSISTKQKAQMQSVLQILG